MGDEWRDKGRIPLSTSHALHWETDDLKRSILNMI